MAIVKLGKMSFEYNKETLVVGNLPLITHDDAKELLFNLQDIFGEKGIKLYLAYGTLLGAVRDGDFIKSDYDLDVYIKDEITFFANLEYFKNRGLTLVRARPHNGYSFRFKGNKNCYVDVIILGPLNNIWGIYCYKLGTHAIAKRRIEKDTQIEFLGRKFYCADNTIELLRFWYGDTWNIPLSKSEKDYIYEEKSYHAYKCFKRYLKAPVRYVAKTVLGEKKYKEVVWKFKA